MNARPLLAALGIVLGFASLSAHAIGTHADVTIVDRTTGRELPVYRHEGRAYVAGKPGNEYQVSVRNQDGTDLLAIVSVDGLNVMDGRAANPSQGGYVLGGWQRYDIRGWRKSLEETAAFYFTSIANSYAGRTDRPDNVGVIGVALFERARPRDVAPLQSAAPEMRREKSAADTSNANAPSLAKRSGSMGAPAAAQAPAPGEPLGTGHGRREDSRVTMTAFERATRDPVETIAIYYDSYRNLVAQGVIPTYGQRRDPQPFPRFTPDP